MTHPRVPFVIGVTGKTALPGYEDRVHEPEKLKPPVRELRERVWATLDWIRHRAPHGGPPGALDAEAGKFDPGCAETGPSRWAGLGLADTPIVVLTSLAPGADTVVAEAALDYAAARGADVTVRGALPFPLDVYRRATTFRPAGKESDWQAKEARLDHVVRRIRAQAGFAEERDLFCVGLRMDLGGDPVADLTAEADGVPRRRIRYRAAGEYVAGASRLLLAVCPEEDLPKECRRKHDRPSDDVRKDAPKTPDADDPYAAGTGAIVGATLGGLGFRLPAGSTGFEWTDTGPVLHVSVGRPGDVAQPPGPAMRMLYAAGNCPGATHPAGAWRRGLVAVGLGVAVAPRPDSAAAHGCSDPDEQARRGDAAFRHAVARLAAFNALPANEARESEELQKILEKVSPAGARSFAARLDGLLRVRRRAASRANVLDGDRGRTLVRLVVLIAVAALLLRMFEHWVPASPPAASAAPHDDTWIVHDIVGGLRALWVFGCLTALAAIGFAFWRHQRSDAERDRYDLRALGEALRVQGFWCLAGVPASVAESTMQRQRAELGWVRHAVSGLALPARQWNAGFRALPRGEQVALLRAARTGWVADQARYFRENAAKNQAQQHFWHHWGWTLLAAGLLNVVGKFLGTLFPPVHHAIEHPPGTIALVAAALGAAIVAACGVVAALSSHAGHDAAAAGHHGPVHAGFLMWLLGRAERWGWALVVGVVPFGLSHVLAWGIGEGPAAHGWWLILTALPIVGGGLALAWSERSFHGENARRYQAMQPLFEGADRRLAVLIERYEEKDDPRVLDEIHDVLHHVGREALDETAEWLVLHRTRPLEPFLAG